MQHDRESLNFFEQMVSRHLGLEGASQKQVRNILLKSGDKGSLLNNSRKHDVTSSTFMGNRICICDLGYVDKFPSFIIIFKCIFIVEVLQMSPLFLFFPH